MSVLVGVNELVLHDESVSNAQQEPLEQAKQTHYGGELWRSRSLVGRWTTDTQVDSSKVADFPMAAIVGTHGVLSQSEKAHINNTSRAW